MPDPRNLVKPAHLKDEIWRQHLAWLEVMGKQVDENLVRHQELVKKNGGRAA
jgi:hypothetical protein